MIIFKKISEIRKYIYKLKLNNKKIAFIPTMGSLHKGHISLVNKAKKEADIVITSIFVNPIQFNKEDDYINYKIDIEEDINKLEDNYNDILFIPNNKEIYPKNNNLLFYPEITKFSNILCAKYRKGHIEGVIIIIIKLFNIINPDIVYFGEKDFQQYKIIDNLIIDFNYNITIRMGETIRDKNNLPFSSRNQRIPTDELRKASLISRYLFEIKDIINHNYRENNRNFNIYKLIKKYSNEINNNNFIIEYFEIRDDKQLTIVNDMNDIFTLLKNNSHIRIFIAAYYGEQKVRLIDNLKLI